MQATHARTHTHTHTHIHTHAHAHARDLPALCAGCRIAGSGGRHVAVGHRPLRRVDMVVRQCLAGFPRPACALVACERHCARHEARCQWRLQRYPRARRLLDARWVAAAVFLSDMVFFLGGGRDGITYMRVRTHTHTHTHTHMYTHSHTHAFTPSLLHSFTSSLPHTLTHTLTLTPSHSHSHTHSFTRAHTHTHADLAYGKLAWTELDLHGSNTLVIRAGHVLLPMLGITRGADPVDAAVGGGRHGGGGGLSRRVELNETVGLVALGGTSLDIQAIDSQTVTVLLPACNPGLHPCLLPCCLSTSMLMQTRVHTLTHSLTTALTLCLTHSFTLSHSHTPSLTL